MRRLYLRKGIFQIKIERAPYKFRLMEKSYQKMSKLPSSTLIPKALKSTDPPAKGVGQSARMSFTIQANRKMRAFRTSVRQWLS
jgi:hypothetical protein